MAPNIARFLPALLLISACAAQVGERAPGPRAKGSSKTGASATPAITIPAAVPIGWATVNDLGRNGTTGGGTTTGIRVGSAGDLVDALAGEEPRNILLTRPVTGSFDVGSNKTLIGAPSVVLHGSLQLSGSVNVIVRNLKIVGYNCSDADQCKRGKDAVTLIQGAHHVWFDHCDISDGSDGNLDIVEGSDYVTISWTIFSYSGRRPGAHQFCNLIGNSDQMDEADRGHLHVTFHHDWWADNVDERMPRVRFGQVHVFNSLYTSKGNHYCIGLGAAASILVENNAFVGVRNPINSGKYSDAASTLVERGNLYAGCDGTTQARGTAAFVPPYPYTLESADAARTAVRRGAGPPRPAEGDDDE